MTREEWQNSRKTAFLERVDKAIECIQQSPDPIFADQLASQMGVSYAVIIKYINHDIPKRLDENHELVVKRCGSKRTYQIIDKRDRYPITKTESGYPDPTAAKAIAAALHSRPCGDYAPGTIWPVRVGWKRPVYFLVVSCEKENNSNYLLYGCPAYSETDAAVGKVDASDERVISVKSIPGNNTIYVDTCFVFTRRHHYIDGEKICEIAHSDLRTIQEMLEKRLSLSDVLAHQQRTAQKLQDEKINHDTEVYALKAKIRKLEARLAEKEKEKTLDELKIENALLQGKVQAYESVTNLTRKPLYATKEDVIAGNILNEMANRRGLASQILFGKGDRMRDTTRVKDPIFEAVKAWGQEHPDVVVQMEYDAPSMKIRFRMTWLPNSTFVTEHDVDFIVYDQRRSSDQATAEFTFNVLDKMYKEGGYGHE